MVSFLETCYVILSILPALVRLSCDYSEEGYTNISKVLSIEPVGPHMVGIFWGQLLGNIPQECVEHVELRDGNGRTVGVVKAVEEIRNKKPFTVDMKICEESNQTFQVIFTFKLAGGKLISVSSDQSSYKVAEFFLDTAVPAYCYLGSQLRLYPLQNMIQPDIYSACITAVDTCECEYCTQCELVVNTGAGYTAMVLERYAGYKEDHYMRLYYYWNHHTQTDTEQSAEIKIPFKQGHCDPVFRQGIVETGQAEKLENETFKATQVSNNEKSEGQLKMYALRAAREASLDDGRKFPYIFIAITAGVIVLLLGALVLLTCICKARHCCGNREGKPEQEPIPGPGPGQDQAGGDAGVSKEAC